MEIRTSSLHRTEDKTIGYITHINQTNDNQKSYLTHYISCAKQTQNLAYVLDQELSRIRSQPLTNGCGSIVRAIELLHTRMSRQKYVGHILLVEFLKLAEEVRIQIRW